MGKSFHLQQKLYTMFGRGFILCSTKIPTHATMIVVWYQFIQIISKCSGTFEHPDSD